MLLFSVDYWKDIERFTKYTGKLRNSTTIIKEVYGSEEVYKLDDIEFRCTVPGCRFRVLDKQGNTELDLNCACVDVPGVEKEVQRARFDMYINFLSELRQVYLKKTLIEKQAKANQAKAAKIAHEKEYTATKVARIANANDTKKLVAAKGVILEATKPQNGK